MGDWVLEAFRDGGDDEVDEADAALMAGPAGGERTGRSRSRAWRSSCPGAGEAALSDRVCQLTGASRSDRR